jgi:hypothetical protein
MSFSHQWQRCSTPTGGCADIAGATTASYQPDANDVGQYLRIITTADNSVLYGGATAIATSAISDQILARPPVNLTLPVLSGVERHGQTLSVSKGTWDGTNPMSFAYQWQRCNTVGSACIDVPGATASSYTLLNGDVAKTFRARVTATNSGAGAGSASATSLTSGIIQALVPVNTLAPVISGTPRPGNTVTADQGTWTGSTPMTFSYEWQAQTSPGVWTTIAGASSAGYALDDTYVGKKVRVLVTASNSALPGGAAVTATSSSIDVLAQKPQNVIRPSFTGNLIEGQVLTAVKGTWQGTAPITYTYQWWREGTPGVFAPISGATASTYTLAAADVGHQMRLRVNADNSVLPGGGTAGVHSDPQGPVAGRPPTNTVAPMLFGSAQDTNTLTAWRGSWTTYYAGVTYAYQWQVETSPGVWASIVGATSVSYTLTSAQIAKRVRVAVTAANSPAFGSSFTVAYSSPTAAVTAIAPSNVTPPTISGPASLDPGDVVSVVNGTWDGSTPMNFTYQWQRCNNGGNGCSNIAGATATSYTVTNADRNRRLRINVTATNVAGNDTSLSNASSRVS